MISEGAALFDLEIDGGKAVPVVVKEQQLHPVRGSLQHIDLQEVKLDEAIQAEVAIELEGAETAPGVKGGGVLEHVTREITVEALPTDIPDRIVVDVSAMEINDTLQLSVVTPPSGVTFIADDPEEVTIVTLSPPRVEEEPEPEVEEETELVGEGEVRRGRGREARRGRRLGRLRGRVAPVAVPPPRRARRAGRPHPHRRAGQPRARARRRLATTSASRSPRSWPGAGTCRGRGRSSAASSPKAAPGPAARGSRCCCRRPS